MKQAFSFHALAGTGTEPMSIDLRSGDIVTEYLSYVALVSIAAAVVIVSLGFSANVAVGFLNRIVKPTFTASEALVAPAVSTTPNGVWRTSTVVAR